MKKLKEELKNSKRYEYFKYDTKSIMRFTDHDQQQVGLLFYTENKKEKCQIVKQFEDSPNEDYVVIELYEETSLENVEKIMDMFIDKNPKTLWKKIQPTNVFPHHEAILVSDIKNSIKTTLKQIQTLCIKNNFPPHYFDLVFEKNFGDEFLS